MPITPASLPRHELVDLAVEVVDATDPTTVGIEGTVVAETTETLTIERDERAWQVPKAGTTFVFETPAGEAVTVEGDRLVARPARRTETDGDSRWR